MATLSEVCSRAVGLLGINPLGDTPSAEEVDAVFTAAQEWLMQMAGSGIGGPMADVIIDSDYEAGENERILDTSGTATVTRPDTISDAITGMTRSPIDGAVVQIAGGGTWIYVRERGEWVQINALALTDANPLGSQFDRHLAAVLAVQAAPLLQTAVPDVTAGLSEIGRRAIAARFGSRLQGTIDRGLLPRGGARGRYNIYTNV